MLCNSEICERDREREREREKETERERKKIRCGKIRKNFLKNNLIHLSLSFLTFIS